jgi:phospholipid-transporting ATPase
MKSAGIKVWVLTGDKIETAINIGFSSGLLDNDMIQIEVSSNEESGIRQQIIDGINTINNTNTNKKMALVVSGEALTVILADNMLKQNFLNIGVKVDVVLACRVSPKQKADIV